MEVVKNSNGGLQDRDNNFDLLRLLAATQVVFIHFNHLLLGGSTSQPAAFFWYLLDQFPGVPIFYFISGFLISKSVERNRNKLSLYFVARALRIYPALWVCTLFGALALLFFNQFEHANLKEISGWLLEALTCGTIKNPDFLRGFGVGAWNGSLWTISIEISFYIFLAIVYKFVTDKRRLTILILVCLAGSFSCSQMAFNTITNHSRIVYIIDQMVEHSLLGYLWMFLLGVACNLGFRAIRPFVEGRALVWLVFYLLFIYLVKSFGSGVGAGFSSFGKMAFLCLLVISVAYTRRTLCAKLLRNNDISYGIYLYHMPVINCLIQLGFVDTCERVLGDGAVEYVQPSKHANYLTLALILIITVGLATASWFLMERKALQSKRRVLQFIRSKTSPIPKTA